MDIETKLARYIANTGYDDLPDKVVDATKKCIIDTLGVTVAGSGYSIGETIVNQVKDWGGKAESTIMVYGGKVPCHNAALANGTMARTLDLSGVHEKAISHPNEGIIPTSLALAETGKGSGKEFIVSVALGIDLACRLQLVPQKPKGFIGHSVLGAATAASKMLKLDAERTLNALGIAYCLTSGNLQMILDNISGIHVHQGFRASTGVLSALWAQKGVTGTKNFVEGDYGLYTTYENREDCDFTKLTSELGERFEITNVSIKPYPTCKHTHTAIYATLEVVKENHIRPEDIEEIVAYVNQKAHEFVGTPLEKKRRPQNPIEAQFSIPFLLGVAVVNGNVFIDDITETAIKNPDFLNMAQKVRTVMDADIEKVSSEQIGPAVVEITTKGGQKFQKRADFAIGHPQNPMSLDQVVEKFKSCLPYAARPLDKVKTDKSIEMLVNLERVHDVSAILDLLT